MDVVSVINSAVDPVYASTKSCKRICLRLRTRNQRVQYVSLQLLEYCVTSCGEAFHSQLAKSDLLNNQLSRMADRSIWCASEIQRMILALVQKWAYEIQYPQFSTLYNRLKQKGLPFEPRAEGEKRFQPYPGLPSHMPSEQNGKHALSTGEVTTTVPNRPPSRGTAHLGSDLLRPQRSPAELTSDLEVARGTVALLNEVLNGAEKDGTWETVKEEYCVEVARACQSLTDRLAALLGSGVSNETIVSAALEINDDAQRALDRRLALIEIADGKRPAPQIPSKRDDEPQKALLEKAPEKGPEKASKTEQKKSEDQPPLLDLLDLDWTPPPVEDSAGKEASGGTLSPPAQLPQVQLNNPFAPTVQQSVSSLPAERFPAPLPPATAPPAPSGPPAPQLQGGPLTADAPNPFLNDDAFAQLSRESEAKRPQQSAAAQQTGNPFAMEESHSAVNQPVTTSAPSKRPPSLIVPGSDAVDSGFYPSLGPLTAPPAFYAPPSAGVPPSSVPLSGNMVTHPHTSTGAAYPYHNQPFQPTSNQQLPSMIMADYGTGPNQNPSAGGYASYPAAYPPPMDGYPSGGFGGYGAPTPHNQSTGIARPSDAFGDLVAISSRRQEPSPPPRGSPMRADGIEGTVTPVGRQSRPSSGQQAVAPPRSGADAFDAFDALAGQR